MSQKRDSDCRENLRFFRARSVVMAWSPDIFTYVDDGKRGTSDMSVTTETMDIESSGSFTPHRAGKRMFRV